MPFPKRAARSLVSLIALSYLLAHPAGAAPRKAEAAAAAPAVPWLYKGSDVPPDKEWVFGELPNGLKYAVRHNGVPPGQVSIRIRVDAGSLNEREDEQGFAHFIEHLVFRESKYLGPGEAIPAWQRLGATFGTDTNAETTPTNTVFKLDLPNATPANLDETMKYLSGMVTAPTLSDADIDTDRPIVLSEMRERGGAASRVQDRMREVFYSGQPLADRAPIGTTATLNNAHAAGIRGFYQRWYRPENTVVVIAGDADTATLEAEVRKWFADWHGDGPLVPPPSFGAPKAPDAVAIEVEPELPRNVTYAVLRPWHRHDDTIVYNQGLMLDALAQQIINRRLESKARRGGSYLTAQIDQENVSRSADSTFVSITPIGPDWRAALAAVRGVIADAMASPPTQEEIDREAAEMDLAFQVPVEQRPLLPGAKVADDLVSALDIRETVAAPEDVLRIFRSTKPQFTPANVLAHTRALFTGTTTRTLLVTPKTGEATVAALQGAMTATPVADPSVRLASKPVQFEGLAPVGAPGTIVSRAPTSLLEIEQIAFANGVRVLLWPTNDEPGRVQVKVRFGAGYRAFGPKDAAYAALGQLALVGSGEGTLSEDDLDRITTGRKMQFNFSIDDAAFQFQAETRNADLADQLFLFADKFAHPRWDPNPLLRAKSVAALQYDSSAGSPQGVLSRDLKYLQRDRDPRYRAATPAELQSATPAGFKDVWTRALAQGPIEVQVFGDVDREATVAALTRTFGALPQRTPLPAGMVPASARFPAANTKPVVVTHHGDANQAAAVISWPTGGGSAGIAESRRIEVLTQLFTNRLMDALREKLGASYAPQVFAQWPVDLNSGGSITAIAQLDPKSVPVFFQTASQIADDLGKAPPTADELARVIEPLRQQITRAATSSAYFMYQLEGATADPQRIAAIGSLLNDYTQTSPAAMELLARQYLRADKAWKLAVLPDKSSPARK